MKGKSSVAGHKKMQSSCGGSEKKVTNENEVIWDLKFVDGAMSMMILRMRQEPNYLTPFIC